MKFTYHLGTLISCLFTLAFGLFGAIISLKIAMYVPHFLSTYLKEDPTFWTVFGAVFLALVVRFEYRAICRSIAKVLIWRTSRAGLYPIYWQVCAPPKLPEV